MKGFRKERLGELLLQFLAEELRSLADPRIRFVTVTDIELTADLSGAKLFWSSLRSNQPEAGGFLSDGEQRSISGALDGVTGLLRRRIREEFDLRQVPDLTFHYDRSLEQGVRIDRLLAQVGSSEQGKGEKS